MKASLAALVLSLQFSAAGAIPVVAADALTDTDPAIQSSFRSLGSGIASSIAGRATALDGRTLLLSNPALRVRLAGIDTCELPQWAFDPQAHGQTPILKPVACGALAKAWLQRSIGAKLVECKVSSLVEPGTLAGTCTAGGRDLAIEMLRVGWARVVGPSPFRRQYLVWQRGAMNARYGMWAHYVLDMEEWRRAAVDRTLSRRPLADFNLLAERESEISPPFEDARKRPQTTDR
ncbi:thermonuclease family protein [Pseudaminobacter sp. NGMCC 1.201702]|uniref:thermonuclease family protein n=1 Tax=Pseudaminobacter sp. NGMCC 1.201702 TaxID=3391825 RepID=UPI0039EFF213